MTASTLIMLTTLAAAGPEELKRMSARFTPAPLKVDTTSLAPADRKALTKLLEAARRIDGLYMTQLWAGNHALHEKLKGDRSAAGKAHLDYFWRNKGPWSDLDEHRAFVPGAPQRKPLGANFYPPDMTKEEFESWVKTLPESERKKAESFFTVIRRDEAGKLKSVAYANEYERELGALAKLLREAAALTTSPSLKKFLNLRAEAFLSNDYYASDVAWMDLDSSIDVTIGPYETYTDELLGYKAAFEAYICLRDEKESAKLKFFANHLQEIENNLPVEARYRNPKLGALAPITVVNQMVAAGDAAHGVATAAFNLPNDEKVVLEKGSKRVMLKNVQQAKFEKILKPIAARMLGKADLADLSFDSFFTHILAHELSHGIGPQKNVRTSLKELYGAIEEAKADITGLFMLQYMFDKGLLPRAEKQLYTTFLASSFRTLRFGIQESHGRGMAVQLNYLLDKGGFVIRPDGTFGVDYARIKDAVRGLTGEILTIEAEGDYAGAKKLIESMAVIRPPLAAALKKLEDLPTDITPVEPK
ncbi:MAG: hypothetical protein SFV51_00540 [Bryobacteraceae bacterium]|nr:hypothetical protein [Bryobacteraceae bacterium]